MPKADEEVIDRGDIYLPDEEDEIVDDLDDDDEDLDDEDEELEEEEDEDLEEEEEEGPNEDDEDEGSDEDEDPVKEEDIKIPKSRLDQVLRQRDRERSIRENQDSKIEWLEKQLETLISTQRTKESEIKVPEVEYDFDTAENNYIEFVLQGDVKEAAALRREIDKARDQLYAKQVIAAKEDAAMEALNKAESSRDEERFQIMLEDITAEYDFLDDESENYNEKAVKMANNLMASYIQEGKSKSLALKLAVEDILPFYEKKEEKEVKTKLASKRKIDARRKAAKASSQQPPSSKSVKGKRTREINPSDISKMTEKQYRELSAKEKARLRGDIL